MKARHLKKTAIYIPLKIFLIELSSAKKMAGNIKWGRYRNGGYQARFLLFENWNSVKSGFGIDARISFLIYQIFESFISRSNLKNRLLMYFLWIELHAIFAFYSLTIFKSIDIFWKSQNTPFFVFSFNPEHYCCF